MSPKRAVSLNAENRARLLRAADDRPAGERLLAYLVVQDGLSLSEALSLKDVDVVDDVVAVMNKTGKRESRMLSPSTADLVRAVKRDAGADGPLVTGRSGRALSAAAARDFLLRLARQADVPLRSVHQLASRRVAVAA